MCKLELSQGDLKARLSCERDEKNEGEGRGNWGSKMVQKMKTTMPS